MSYPSMMSGIAPPPLPGPAPQAPAAARPLLLQIFSCSGPHHSPLLLRALSSHLRNNDDEHKVDSVEDEDGDEEGDDWSSAAPSPPSRSSPAPPSPCCTALSAPSASPAMGKITPEH